MACNYNLHKQGVRRNAINHTNGKDCYCEQHQEQKHKGGENVTAFDVVENMLTRQC
jgi:hypothetical protein